MEVHDALKTRIEIRSYSSKEVDDKIKKEILEYGRLSPSGRNTQHWRFILVDEKENIQKLKNFSKTGGWIQNADFAIIVLTDPQHSFNKLDAGRAITYLQLSGWEKGVGSCIYTECEERKMKNFFNIPDRYTINAVIGFGYPEKKIKGEKNRKPLSEIAYKEKFDRPIDI